MERARLEAEKKNTLADQEVNDRKDRAYKRSQTMGARKLAISDVRRLMESHFGDSLTARCGHQPCANSVNAAKGCVVAKGDYTTGMADLQNHARVVCPTHAKECSDHPVKHMYSLNPRLVELWLYRVGSGTTHATCGICGFCPLRLWGDVELCHVVPSAAGGSSDEDNLILGASACNRQQGREDMGSFARRISSSATAAHQLKQRVFEKMHLSKLRKELMSFSFRNAGRDALQRMTAYIEKTKMQGRSRQSTLNMHRGS
jgi:hypothetical protein